MFQLLPKSELAVADAVMCKGKGGDSARLGTIARDAFDSTKIFAARLTPSEKCYEARFQAVFDTIARCLKTPVAMKKAIGFHVNLQPPAKSAKPNTSRCK
jgi:hypothetical protein